jgi:predicted DNA-binding transcriptional regulator YafY
MEMLYWYGGDAMVNYILQYSLEQDCVITIFYQKGSDITVRNIKVLDIRDGNVSAYCYLRKQLRVFKLENILSAGHPNRSRHFVKCSQENTGCKLKKIPVHGMMQEKALDIYIEKNKSSNNNETGGTLS